MLPTILFSTLSEEKTQAGVACGALAAPSIAVVWPASQFISLLFIVHQLNEFLAS